MATKRKSSNAGKWDLDSHKTDHESDEHWNLRRRFMEVHKDKFPEDQLVCLAQVFVNIEFMGCKYPSETMRLVGELSQEVAKEFRAKRASRLKRTFVKASDAAEARAKGRKTQQQPQQKSAQFNNRSRKGFGTGDGVTNTFAPAIKKPVMQCNLFEGLPFGKFVLHLTGGRNCLRTSAQRANIEFTEREFGAPGERKTIEILINGKSVASAAEENMKLTKSVAFTKSLEMLQKTCYSIKSNPARDKIKIDKSGDKVICDVTKQPVEDAEEKRLDANNKGFKIMQMMGWTGGGLGSKTQGREDPVGYLLKNNRSGLGTESMCNLDRTYFTQILRNYLESEDIRELQFEPTFAKNERAILHELAGKFQLKSTSHGKGDERSLVISKKNITDEQILTEVLIHKNSRFCDKYLVQVPMIKAKDFPDHTMHLELDS